MNKKDINELDINGFEGPAKNEKKTTLQVLFQAFRKEKSYGDDRL